MRRPEWASLLWLAEWLAYLLSGGALIAGAAWLMEQILVACGLYVESQSDALKLTIGALGACVFALVILVNVVRDVRTLLGRSRRGPDRDERKDDDGDRTAE